jgi:uncharacterized protein YerC
MGKLDYRKIPRLKFQEDIARTLDLFEELGLNKRGQSLLRRLLMDSEWLMAIRRMEIARRMLQGESFVSIRRDMGVGWTTIEHVDRWLDEELGAAREAIRKKCRENPWHEAPLSPRWFAKMFPDHFPLLRAVLGLERRGR